MEQTIWSEFAGNLPNAPVSDLRYDDMEDRLYAGMLGRGVWQIENASTWLLQDSSISVYGTADNDTFEIIRNAANPALLDIFVSHFAFPHLTIPVQAAAKINVIGGEGDDALVINIQNGAIPVALGISFDGGNDVTGDTLTLTGGTLTQYPSGAQEYRFVDSNGIEQSVFRNSTVEFVDLTGLEAPNLNETNALLSMSGGFEFLSSKLADPFASLEMPVLGKSLGDVLSGRLISDLSPPSLPGLGFNSPQVLQGVGDVSEQFLRRIFEDASTGDFSFATIGDTISSLEELKAALDAIDNFDGKPAG